MPTYVYRCSRCGSEIEVFQSMSDPPLKRCRACRGALRRVFHPVGIVLKGSGFYKTDYARAGGSKKEADGSDKKPADTDKSSSDGAGKSGAEEKPKPSKPGSGDKTPKKPPSK